MDCCRSCRWSVLPMDIIPIDFPHVPTFTVLILHIQGRRLMLWSNNIIDIQIHSRRTEQCKSNRNYLWSSHPRRPDPYDMAQQQQQQQWCRWINGMGQDYIKASTSSSKSFECPNFAYKSLEHLITLVLIPDRISNPSPAQVSTFVSSQLEDLSSGY